MEEAQKAGNARRLFQLIRATGPRRPPVSKTMKHQNGKIISNKEECLDRWAELFEQQLPWPPAGTYVEPTGDVEPWTVNVEPPTASEVYDCICSLKCHRASGPDELPPAFFKDGGEILSHRLSNLGTGVCSRQLGRVGDRAHFQKGVEGKGNGIKTVIVNVSDIAKALNRKPIYDHEVSTAGDENSGYSPTATALDGDDDDWGEDTTEEAQLQRMSELSAMAQSLALSVDVDKSESEKADVFYKHLLQLQRKNAVLSHRRDIRQQADSLDLGPRAVLVLAEALLSSPTAIIGDIKKFAPVFLLFTRVGGNEKRAQQYVLGAMAKLIERYTEHNLLSKACHILKALYDNDIIEEDVIIAWYEKGGTSEATVDVEPKESPPATESKDGTESEDEIDIDAI
ncbi:translation initiation factor 5 [Clonorchis sinensis]|uniref:Translation initiation factor 5 n=1 Tax=Clonorchis sinensis TaxID=79923 RepID=G7YUJ5_CLOSI|nr:translation initiation factor 5 [Clonorchis sinensis]